MSKGNSGLFKRTIGFLKQLKEDYFERFMPDGKKNIDFEKLPGAKGIQVKRRLTEEQMQFLTKEYGVEFAQVYILGNGKNGRGGKYYVFSGDDHTVHIPIAGNVILIGHTHPRGTEWPSDEDKDLMGYLRDYGSPQKVSRIYPVGKKTVKFTKEGVRK